MHRRLKKLVVEYFASLLGGVLVGGVATLFGGMVLRLPGAAGGTWIGSITSLIAITLLCFGVAIGGGEPVYRLGRRDRPEWGRRARKQIWKGAFLGAPCVIALLSLTEMDWIAIMSNAQGSGLGRIFFVVIGVVQYVVTVPVRVLVDVLGVPAEVVMIAAIPVGAMLVAHLARPESMRDEEQDVPQSAGEKPPQDDSLTTVRTSRR